MKPAAFEYVRARSAREAAELLASGSGATRLLAGGQSLGPMLNLRLARPHCLVDVKRAAGLRALAADDSTLSIGAAFTHAEIEDGVVEDPTRGLLRHVASSLAYRAVRNRGTLGGSLAHGDPAAEWISVMAALGAAIEALGPGERSRRIGADEFLRGAFATALAEDEVLTSVLVPRSSPDARWGYVKLCRKTGEFAQAIGLALLDPARECARVLAGAVEGKPVLLPETAARLRDHGPTAAAGIAADEIASSLPHLTPASRAMHVAAVARAILQVEIKRED